MTYIIKRDTNSKYSDRGSVFLGFLFALQSTSDFKIKLKEVRNNYPTSTHVCSAYRIINSNIIEERGSDDGEPRGSAGFSILNELKRFNIVNVGMFVVRYYGGSKLGISGLIHAYSYTAKLALENCSLIHWESKKKYVVNHSYQDINSIDSFIKKCNGNLLNRKFDLFVQSTIEIKSKSANDFKAIIDLKAFKIDSFFEIE